MTSVPPVVIGPTGVSIPSTAAVLAGVQEDLNAAFGGDLNPALNTPQGQLATSEAAVIDEVNAEFLFLANQFDPAFASGRYQDALARIYFLERNPAQPTVVQALCSGLLGVVIPVGAIAIAADGNRYTCTEAGTIPIGGSITLTFACLVPGPIACPEGTLSQIYQAIPGWDSITNPSDGVIGNNTESRSAFEARRIASVAANSLGSLGSILGAVLSVPDVIDAYVTENDSNSPATIGGVSLNPNSVYVAVVGGEAQAVAQAIWSHKAPGCAYNGNTSVTVQDTSPGYVPPYPTYTVQFEIPPALPILFAVNIANGPQVPSNANVLIQNAIIAAFAGGDGGPRAKIGVPLYASRFYAPIAAVGSWVQIISIEVGSTNTAGASFTGSVAGNVLTVSAISAGALAVGQTISDVTGDLIVGTTILSQSSGSAGSTGTYVISNAHPTPVGSELMQAAVANLFDVSVRINQTPTINAADIQVTLT